MSKQVPTLVKILAIVAPLLCLALPSIWLLMTVPPLWRDSDAYYQLTAPPGPSTILLHGPLYCALARLPLWLGYLATGGGTTISFGDFMLHPRLTDAGIDTLLWTQHVGLWIALFYLVAAVSTSLIVRTGLAIICASQPVFYAYAHCVGSETLSMILIVFLVGIGLRIAVSYPKVEARHWLTAGAILFCCVLTRHINSVLAALLPLAIVMIALDRWLKPGIQGGKNVANVRFEFAQHARPLMMSIAVGLAALLLANGCARILAREARIQWRSRVGFTFLWRLNFLRSLPPTDRHHLIERIAVRTNMPESQRLFSFLEAWDDQHQCWEPGDFAKSARVALRSPGIKSAGERFDRSLNDLSAAFLRPPPGPLISAAWHDFEISTGLTEGAIARYLFATTEFVNDHREVMPQSTALTTFRRPPETFLRFRTATYFRLWDFLSFRGWLLAWLAIAGTGVFVLRHNNPRRGAIIMYASTVFVLGVVMTFLTCFFAQILPRFALPMMELVLLSLVILLGLLLPESAAVFRAEPAP